MKFIRKLYMFAIVYKLFNSCLFSNEIDYSTPEKICFLGVGPAFLDIRLYVSKDFLELSGVRIGEIYWSNDNLLSSVLHRYVSEYGKTSIFWSIGGSFSKIMLYLSSMGVKCLCANAFGEDSFGGLIEKEFLETGIENINKTENNTCKRLMLCTPEGNSIMISGKYMNKNKFEAYKSIDNGIFSRCNTVFIDSVLLHSGDQIESLLKSAHINNNKVIFHIKNTKLVACFKNRILHLISGSNRVVLLSYDAACILSGLKESIAICNYLKNFCGVVILKDAKDKGCWIAYKDKIVYYQHPINYFDSKSTSSNSLIFEAGFIFGLMNELPIDMCITFGWKFFQERKIKGSSNITDKFELSLLDDNCISNDLFGKINK